ncbi:MAG: Na+/H+ antiporter NhaC family protein [Rickettsiales bacterium]|nr:Na+/H+ antiporter NhaC family protein [Rickettsiales bacterium]
MRISTIVFGVLGLCIALPAFAEVGAAEVSVVKDFGELSLLPALLAIGMAFLTRQVFVSLFVGIWAGAAIMEGGLVDGFLQGLLRVVDTYMLRALVPADGSGDHMSVVGFTLLIGGTIGIISANGGMRGVVHWITKFAHNRTRGQLSTYLLGFVVFFDDYANTLIVGKTMRPMTDKLGISREKLAFLVDSTAAPLACVALVTTWIGFQISLLEGVIKDLEGFELSAYELFVESISYSFYPLLMLIFIVFIIVSRRDFGPMLAAEKRAIEQMGVGGKEEVEQGNTGAFKAAIPIAILIGTTIYGLFVTGDGSGLREILGSADPFRSMLWAALLSLISAILISVFTKSLNLSSAMEAMEDGFKPMLMAVMILTFAWAIADVNTDLRTAQYVVSFVGDGMSAEWLPLIVFVIAAITAFATGSSWGTMGILIPLVIPLAWSLVSSSGLEPAAYWPILFSVSAGVMSGAVWGDHCSPISDTTILSSLASDCSHMDHVRTQMPYALFVAAVAIISCVIPCAYGLPSWLGLGIGAAILWFGLRFLGTKLTVKLD